ncbi:hypothetical protein DV532_29800 (plasmid) [Pseudomonas sp. Leaf58]|uniref:hypothetical protein n=1 Tax=Pseudomonas sp. Leaf58 TaxID=1736226 RepID=UPI0006F6936E|nr:hypothetical protein [Pseudomonas sp. Leaf58]AYG48434.1 hypothetical protein DV532_29800 [Pseudomonas sp. Leaf58]KQN62021.1 hypothetical protein ASF02_07520 [Pseudomonas sp. Leaf58]
MHQAHASKALAEALMAIDPFNVTPEVGKPIEDLLVDMLREGLVMEVRAAVIQAQKSWGTLPEKSRPGDEMRFIPHINPFLRFLREGNTDFLRSVKNHFFGFTGAGLTMDVAEKRYKVDTYFRYRYSLPITAAIAHYGKDFAVFDCTTKTQLSHFCRLFADKDKHHADLYGFTRDLDFDYKNFHVWGSATELNYYELCDNLVISAGMGPGFVTSDATLLTQDPDPRLIKRQDVLWKALNHRENGVMVLGGIINQSSKAYFNGKPISAAGGAKFFWELMPRIADVLSENLKIDRNEVVKTLLLKGLEMHWGGQDSGFETSTTQWVDLDAILPLVRPRDREYVVSRLQGAVEKLNEQVASLLEDDLGI